MQDELRTLFCSVLRLQPEEVVDDLSLGQVSQWDSLGHMNLIAAMEQAYGFELSFEEIVVVRSFADACRLVAAKTNRLEAS